MRYEVIEHLPTSVDQLRIFDGEGDIYASQYRVWLSSNNMSNDRASKIFYLIESTHPEYPIGFVSLGSEVDDLGDQLNLYFEIDYIFIRPLYRGKKLSKLFFPNIVEFSKYQHEKARNLMSGAHKSFKCNFVCLPASGGGGRICVHLREAMSGWDGIKNCLFELPANA